MRAKHRDVPAFIEPEYECNCSSIRACSHVAFPCSDEKPLDSATFSVIKAKDIGLYIVDSDQGAIREITSLIWKPYRCALTST